MGQRSLAIGALVVALVPSAFACGDSVFTSATDGGADASSASDASNDAPLVDDAGILDGGSVDAGVHNYLDNPGFEDRGDGGCGPGWVASNATTSLTIVDSSVVKPVNGTASCLVCSNNPGSGAAISSQLGETGLGSVKQGTWFGSAWVMADPMQTPSLSVYAELDENNGAQMQSGTSVMPNIMKWTEVDVSAPLSVGESLQLEVIGLNNSSGCFLIDDAALTFSP